MVWLAVEEYFSSKGWWEDVLVFYGAIKQDISALMPELHRHLAQSDTVAKQELLRRILSRWSEVAELHGEVMNCRGAVRDVLTELRH